MSILILLICRQKEWKQKENIPVYLKIFLGNLSGLQPRKRSKKYNIIKGGCFPTFHNSHDDVIDFLELIIGSTEAGNDNNNMKNKEAAIIDELLKLDAVSNYEHEILYNQNFI